MDSSDAPRKTPDVRTLVFWGVFGVLSAASAWVLGDYLQIGSPIMASLGLFVLMILAASGLPKRSWSPKEIAWLSAYSVLLAGSITVGRHIVVTEGYKGTMADNYLTPFSSFDLLAWLLISVGLLILTAGIWSLIAHMREDGHTTFTPKATPPSKVKVLIVAGVLFLAWLPWLIAWWPGYVHPDSVSSIRQALGVREFVNQHPVMYALLMRVEFGLGHTFGLNNTACVALYNVVQMLFCAGCLAYFSCWICERGGLGWPWLAALTVAFGVIRYVASFMISVWKDPMWTLALLLLCIMLYDLVISRGEVAKRPAWLVGLALMLFVVTFIRTNGIAVLALMLLTCGISWLVLWRKSRSVVGADAGSMLVGLRNVTLAVVAFIAAYLVFTGPVFAALNVEDLPVERVGLQLNQMCRVVAYHGNMSEEDRAYMDSITPIDRYSEVYHPCCIDMFKWNWAEFHSEPLEDNFWGHWMSMLVKNPVIYAEQWVMQTHGFWAVNCPHINTYDQNIRRGDPLNIYADDGGWLDETDVEVSAPDNWWDSWFDFEVWALPIGWCLWIMGFLMVCLILTGEWRWLLSLVPAIAVEGTLFLASPIWYWPRYAATLQFLLPFFALVFWLLVGRPMPGRKSE